MKAHVREGKTLELVDDLTLFTVLALAAAIHNDPVTIRGIARGFETRVRKARRSTMIAIRKARDPKALINLGLMAYESPPEEVAVAQPVGPIRDPKTGRWMKRQ